MADNNCVGYYGTSGLVDGRDYRNGVFFEGTLYFFCEYSKLSTFYLPIEVEERRRFCE